MNKYTETKDVLEHDREISYKSRKKIYGILSKEWDE
jgi:hypothetical protein